MKSNGPVINNTVRNFTARDCLGIEGIATSISGQICPVVNTVTPRPYFWAFIDWCYYDFYEHSRQEDWKYENVRNYVKRINYFIALGTVLCGKHNVTGRFPGIDYIVNHVDRNSASFEYIPEYLKTISTITYYFAGLDTMELVVNQDRETMQQFPHPMIRPEGKRLALAFNRVIENTEFYKSYRHSNLPVPKETLKELGQVMNVDLTGFDECKQILIQNLFERERNKRLRQCKDLVNYALTHDGIHLNSTYNCRNVLFDLYASRGAGRPLDDSLRETVDDWEVVVGRQYFTVGLEMIWQAMITRLLYPMSGEEWISTLIEEQKETCSFDMRRNLSTIIDNCDYSFSEREQIVRAERGKPSQDSLENGLSILLCVYNRFKNRTDLSDYTKSLYNEGTGPNTIALSEYFSVVEKHLDQPVEVFLRWIMTHYLLEQHLKTAFNKLLQDRDNYFIREINGQYYRKENYTFDFQGIRLVQLYSVMSDLGVLAE